MDRALDSPEKGGPEHPSFAARAPWRPAVLAVHPPPRWGPRILLGLLFLLLFLVGAGLLFVSTDTFSDRLRAYLVEEVARQYDVDLSIGRLSLRLWGPEVILEEVALKPRGGERLLTAGRIELGVKPLELLRRRVVLDRLVVDGFALHLEVKDGRILNLPRIPERREPSLWEVWLGRIQLHRGELSILARASKGLPGGSLRKALVRLVRARGLRPPPGELRAAAQIHAVEIEAWELPQSRWSIGVVAKGGRFEAAGWSDSIARLEALAALSAEGLVLHHLELGLGRSHLALLASGVARGLSDLGRGRGGKVEGKVVLALPAQIAHRFSPQLPDLGGTLALDLDLVASGKLDWRASGRLEWKEARVEHLRLGDVRLRFEADPAGLHFEETRVAVAGGFLATSGRIGFTASPEVDLVVRLGEARLSRILELLKARQDYVDLTASGTLRVKGRASLAAGFRPDFTATADLEVDNFIVLGDPPARKRILVLPYSRIEGGVEVNPQGVRLADVRVQTGASQIWVNGEVQNRGWLNLKIQSNDMHLEELGTIAGLPWSGRGKLQAAVRGPARDPVVLGSLEMSPVSFAQVDLERLTALVEYAQKRLFFPVATAERGRARVSLSAAIDFRPDDPLLEVDAEIVRGRSEEFLRILRLPSVYEARFAGEVEGAVHLRGKLERPTGWGHVRLTAASIYGEPVHEVDARGSYTKEGWTVERITVLKTPTSGKVEMYGAVTPGNQVSFVARSDGLLLHELGFPPIRDLGLEGEADLHAVVEGTLERPTGNGVFTVRHLKVKGVAQQDSALSFRLEGDRLAMSGKLLGDNISVEGRLDLSGRAPFQARIDFREFEFSSLVRGRTGDFYGRATGSGEFSGFAAESKTVRGRLSLSEIALEAAGGYALKNRRPVVLELQGARVVVDSLDLAGRDTELTLSGSHLANGNLDFTVEGKVDLRFLSSFTKAVQAPAGLVRFKSRVTGTAEDPTLLGSGTLSGGRVAFEGFPHDLRDVSAQLRFTANKVDLREFTASFADGVLRGQGDIALKSFVPQGYQFDLKIEGARLRYPADFPSRLAGDLWVTGDLDRVRVGGHVKILQARYTKDVSIAELLLKKERVAPRVFEKKKKWLELAVRVSAQDNIRIVNNMADLEFQGDLNVTGSNRQVVVLGGLRLARPGTFSDKRNTFKVERAFVVFKDEAKIDPFLDIEGVTRVRRYDVLMTIKGPLSDVKIDYVCGGGFGKEDCIALLRFGMTLKELNTVQPGRSANLGVGTTALDTLGAVTGFDEKLVEAVPFFDTFRIGSAYSEYSMTVVPMLTLGKQIQEYVSLYGSTNLIEPSKDFSARVELNLSRNLSITGEYATPPRTSVAGTGVGQPLGNVGIDLRWRYEF
jgi:translocation and assembly module TamB